MQRDPVKSKGSVGVIGAGVIGCAIAYELQKSGYIVTVIDALSHPGQGITSRNSEVIHAGMYYPTGSLKAKLCVEGRNLLYAYCQKYNVAHRQIGKLIIASTADEITELERINAQAQANGITSLRMIDATEVKTMEPHVRAVAALHSPETGIISAHELCNSLEGQAINSGAAFAYHTLATGVERTLSSWKIRTQEIISSQRNPTTLPHHSYAPRVTVCDEACEIEVDVVINCAGLYADWISALGGIDPVQHNCVLTWVKGEYFSLAPQWGKKLSQLIYPVPEKNTRGLGVHVTLDMGGQAKLGPNVVEMDRHEDFSVDATHAYAFFESARKYLPDLRLEEVSPAYAGIRPKLTKAGEKAKDFIIRDESANGAPGLVNLIGIESPGLTCSLAIARYVKELLQ